MLIQGLKREVGVNPQTNRRGRGYPGQQGHHLKPELPRQQWASFHSFYTPSALHSSGLIPTVQQVWPNDCPCQKGQVLTRSATQVFFSHMSVILLHPTSFRCGSNTSQVARHSQGRTVVDLSLEDCGSFPALVSLHARSVKLANNNQEIFLH